MTARPLAGVRIASLAHQYPGPLATMILADLGADVVLVENPNGGDPSRVFPAFFGAMARGKRSVTLDLKSADGQSALAALLQRSDVLLDGFRPGTLARLGFPEERLRTEFPGLVYVTITGFGSYGPLAARPGHDITYQAEAGLLGTEFSPTRPAATPPVTLADLFSGWSAVQAVLLGLFRRERTDTGSRIDVSMVDSLISALAGHLVPATNGTGPSVLPLEPAYGVFTTADDREVAFGIAFEDHFWRALCDAIGLTEERDQGSAERFADDERLRQCVAKVISTRPMVEWEEIFSASDIPFGVVRSLREVSLTPHAVARELFVRVTEADGSAQHYVRQPLVVDGSAWGPVSGVPELGEHTCEVLRECGLDEESIDAVVGPKGGCRGGGDGG